MAELVKFFFTLSCKVKLYHWETKMYSRHKSSDTLFEAVISLMDKFMEVYQGKFGRLQPSDDPFAIQVRSYSDDAMLVYLQQAALFLSKIEGNYKITSKDSDLLNIRDELVAAIQQTIYLFSFE